MSDKDNLFDILFPKLLIWGFIITMIFLLSTERKKVNGRLDALEATCAAPDHLEAPEKAPISDDLPGSVPVERESR